MAIYDTRVTRDMLWGLGDPRWSKFPSNILLQLLYYKKFAEFSK